MTDQIQAKYISPYKHAVVWENRPHVVTKARYADSSERIVLTCEGDLVLIVNAISRVSVNLIDDADTDSDTFTPTRVSSVDPQSKDPSRSERAAASVAVTPTT